MSRLHTRSASFGYHGRPVIDHLDLAVPDGRLTVLVGPNACGKSTLLRGLARLLRPSDGTVLLDGRALHERPSRQVAQMLGLLPQSTTAPEGITVEELISRGRQPHQHWWSSWSPEDEKAMLAAAAQTGVEHLLDTEVAELSGGQRQRAWIALALAQETDLLLLDEPTTYLDIAHQVEVLDLMRALVTVSTRTVVAVLHDLNQAARYADHIVAMADGRIVAQGPPGDVVTPDLVADVFGLACTVIACPATGAPLVVPLPT